jgi:hypothetical protein
MEVYVSQRSSLAGPYLSPHPVIGRLLNAMRLFVPVPINFRSGGDVYASSVDEQILPLLILFATAWICKESHD